jgi:PTH1 family peptidyl-tRNA hydrolase
MPAQAEKERVLVVGLGNPGDRYRDTRHNVGFLIVDQWAKRRGLIGQRATHLTEIYRGSLDGREIWVSKPLTYMNLSGQAVKALCGQKGVQPAQVLVVLDDFAIPLGKLRLRASGSAGGHNGLKSIQAELGTQDYPRLRVGIGPVPERWDPADFVLGRFTREETSTLDDIIEQAGDCLDLWLNQGLAAAMNRFNTAASPKNP